MNLLLISLKVFVNSARGGIVDQEGLGKKNKMIQKGFINIYICVYVYSQGTRRESDWSCRVRCY